MTRKSLILSLVAIAVLSLSAMAVAGPGYGPGGCPGYGGGNGLQQQALTPEQQEKAQSLYDSYEKAIIPLREQLFAKHALLNAAVEAENPDAKIVDALSKDLGELKTKLFTERTELRKKLAEAGIQSGQGRSMGRGNGNGAGPCGGPVNCPGVSARPCQGGGPCGGAAQSPCGGPCPGYGG